MSPSPAKPRVLVVEDEADIRDLLLMTLEGAGFEAFGAADGLEGLEKCLTLKPGCLVLDLMLPRLDGLELCRRLRLDGRFRALPIIMLTARAEEGDRLRGFETGADDYVVKPFSFKELVLRVKALLRRSAAAGAPAAEAGDGPLNFGPLAIDHGARRVTLNGRDLALTALEYKLLHYLASRPGLVMERGRLLEDVWGYQDDTSGRTVDTHVRRLRQKLGPAGACVETIRGAGYRFDPAPLAAG